MKSKKLLKLLGAIGLAVLIAIPLTVGCAAPAPAPAPAPVINTFIWGDYAEWTEMDPSPSLSNEVSLMSQLYETLTFYNYPGEEPRIIPRLATDWSVSEDGLKWTFNLREGVKFHDGHEFDAEAVKYSIERTVEIGKGPAFIWGCVESIEVVDKYTVELNLKYPAPIDIIASSSYGAYIMSPVTTPGKTSDWFWEGHDTGTGPYKIVEYEKGEYTILERFDDYWGGWEDNQVGRIIFKIIPEIATRLKLMKAGEIDFNVYAPVDTVPELIGDPDVRIYSASRYYMVYAHLNTQKPPLDDVRVRQAIAYATPYQEIIDFSLRGYGLVSRGVIPHGMLGHSENAKQYHLDLDKARALLAEAGYPGGGFTLDLNYIHGIGWDKTVEIWMSRLEEIGITVRATGMPWTQAWSIATSAIEERQHIVLYAWWPTYVDPYDFLYSMLHSEDEPIGKYSFHLTYWKNSEFDDYIDTANELIATDREKALELYDKAQQIVMEESPIIPLYDSISIYPLLSKWEGYRFNPAYDRTFFLYDLKLR